MINKKQKLFKWMGGKEWLSQKLQEQAHLNIQDNKTIYIEPFAGGLGSFLALFPILQEKKIEKFIINDINPILILTYKIVKKNPDIVIEEYRILEQTYQKYVPDDAISYHQTKDKVILKNILKIAFEFYKEKRNEFNSLKLKDTLNFDETIKLSALFLFLNKHAFNGIYRENSKGEFNTSFNWSNNIVNVESKCNAILEFSKFFNDNNIVFENMDVFKLLNKYNDYNSSFLYLDPPYLNHDEKTENKYNKDHFYKTSQIKLLEVLNKYNNFIYSNHFFDIFEKYFSKKNHSFIKVNRKNRMSPIDRSSDAIEILGIKNDK